MGSKWDLDTPALLVDELVLRQNIHAMQEKASHAGVSLRPHTKTHRTPALARLQVAAGADGITVAKLGEAEVMVQHGLKDIFIANQIAGEQKLQRLRALNRQARVAVGVDCPEHVAALESVFGQAGETIDVLIEIEVGEKRSGLQPGEALVQLAAQIAATDSVKLRGIFSHEGHTYAAPSIAECAEWAKLSQQTTLDAAAMIRQAGIECPVVSIGATPSLLFGEILPGITEIRPGTYILMDAAQGAAAGFERCAATVLATVVSKPQPSRVVFDTGVKALTAFTREQGICRTPGFGLLKDFENVRLYKLYDEHGLVENEDVYQKLQIGDKIEIIPNHICPTCNLYDRIYLTRGEEVVAELPVACRGKSQ